RRSTESRRARSMARELSQEAVLDFLWGAGGRAPNTALLRHFQPFLRDPALTEQQRRERREYFKSLVNSLATVHPATAPGASKDIVLRRRYRDLLDEELPPPEEQQEKEEKEPPPPRRDPDRRRAPGGEAAEKGRPGDGQPPGVSVAGGCAARGRGGPCCECRRARRAAAAAAPRPGPGAPPPPAGPPRSRSPPPPSAQPPPYRTRPLGAWALHPHGPPHTRPPALPSGPGALTLAGPPPYQTLQPPAARPSRSRSPPLPPGPGVLPPTESAPFGSIRCQLSLLEVQGIPSPLPADCRQQPRILPSKSCPRNVPSRGLSVPLGQREHAWLVAMSAGRWAQVRGLFLEEPELALQRDFMSGFTVLHWLAKHGDGPGLQELAAAARQAGLALDVDARSGCGYTPLHLAAIHGHQLVIKVLVLQLGCQVQVRDSNGRRPWEYLGSSTSGEIWQLLEAP
ncbi:SWAHB protein, partial [Cepphus grylle]|nr:SWAHB protein [Cepphus grylle]